MATFEDAARAARQICEIESASDAMYLRFGQDWSRLGKETAIALEIIDTCAAYIAATLPKGPARERALYLLADAQSNIVSAFVEKQYYGQSGKYKKDNRLEKDNIVAFPKAKLPEHVLKLLQSPGEGDPKGN